MHEAGYYHFSPYKTKAAWDEAYNVSPAAFVRTTAKRLLRAIESQDPQHLSWVEINFLARTFLWLADEKEKVTLRQEVMEKLGLIGALPSMNDVASLLGFAMSREPSRKINEKTYDLLQLIRGTAVFEILEHSVAAPLNTPEHHATASGEAGHVSVPAVHISDETASSVRPAPPLLLLVPGAARERQSCAADTPASVEEKAVTLERATAEHEHTLAVLVGQLKGIGIECDYSTLIDATAEGKRGRMIFEVKSINDDGTNEVDQVRAALAQLLDYRFRYKAEPGFEDSSLWTVLSRPPRLQWTPAFLNAMGIQLVWAESDRIAGPHATLLLSLSR